MAIPGKRVLSALVSAGLFFSVLLGAVPSAGADAGRQPSFSVGLGFKQNETAATAYDMNLGGNLTIDITIQNSGENASDVTVKLMYEVMIAGLSPILIEIKDWTGQAVANDTPTELSTLWNPNEESSIMPGDGKFYVDISGGGAHINESFNFVMEAAVPDVESIIVETTNPRDNTTLVLGFHELIVNATIVNKGNKALVGYPLVVYLDDPGTDGVELGRIPMYIPKNDSVTYQFRTNLSGFTDLVGDHRVYVEPTAGEIKVPLERSEMFSIVEAAPDVQVTGLTASPMNVTIGKDESVEVTLVAALKNRGYAQSPGLNVSFYIDEKTEKLAEIEVQGPIDIEATAEASAVMTVDEGMIGDHVLYAVVGEGGEGYEAQLAYSVLGLANVTVQSVAISPASALEGENVTVTATLLNNGTADALNLTVEFYLGNTQVGTVGEVNVTKGATADVSLNITLPETTGDSEQTVRVKVNEAEGTQNVTVLDHAPKIELSGFAVPDGIRVGDTVAFKVTVKNVGYLDAVDMKVEFYDNTTKLGTSDPFNLSIGASMEVSLNVTIPADGEVNHTFYARAMGSEASLTKSVGRKLNPAAIKVASFTVKPKSKDNQPIDSTQSFTLTLVLSNTGEVSGTITVLIMEKTKQIAKENVTVGPGTNATKTYTWKVKGAGDHKAVVTLTGDVGAPATSEAKCSLKYQTPGFEAVYLAAAIVLVAALVRRRKG